MRARLGSLNLWLFRGSLVFFGAVVSLWRFPLELLSFGNFTQVNNHQVLARYSSQDSIVPISQVALVAAKFASIIDLCFRDLYLVAESIQ